MNESKGLIGRKIGMTQYFEDDGSVIPCTVIEVTPNTVLKVNTEDTKAGYNAIQLGFGTKKASRVNKADAGQFKAAGVDATQVVSEMRLSKADASAHSVGQVINVSEIFAVGNIVDVTGTSKGKGFAGVMKKYNFAGFERSHGVHEFFRHGGSIGTRLTPGHVIKGKKMPGQMGNVQVTVQNLAVTRIDTDRNLVFVKGGVPGTKGSIVTLRHAVKK